MWLLYVKPMTGFGYSPQTQREGGPVQKTALTPMDSWFQLAAAWRGRPPRGAVVTVPIINQKKRSVQAKVKEIDLQNACRRARKPA